MGNEFTNKILKLALPITAQQFMLALVSACDAFMLGGLNQNSLSAISLASQITFVFNLILTALTIGENMFVAQYYGKRDFDGLRTSAGLVLRYVFIISILFLLATFFIPEMLMRLFTNDTILIDYGIKYLKVIGLSYIFSGVLQVLQGILKNCGYAGRCSVTYPSYGYMITNGATTLWEYWEKEYGFYQCPANHNQPMFGSISSFFYEKLAGIKPLKPAYKKIEIKPAMIGDLRFVSSSVKTPYGEVCIDWERNEDEILVSVVIPPNTEAVLLIPGQERKEIGSGNYQFRYVACEK